MPGVRFIDGSGRPGWCCEGAGDGPMVQIGEAIVMGGLRGQAMPSVIQNAKYLFFI